MKILAALGLLFAASYGWAQDYPRFELATGYSYGSVDTQGYGSQRQAQGWSTSFAGNIRRWVGVEAEVSGRYNVLDFDFQGNALTSNSRYYTFLLGPRFAYRKGKAIPFVHSLFGIERAPSFDQTVYDPVAGAGTTPYVTGLASAVGGGVDYAISRRLTFRTQGDYFFTRHAAMVSPTPNNFRVQAAIVFTFGGGESLEAKRKSNGPVLAQTSPASEPSAAKVPEATVADPNPIMEAAPPVAIASLSPAPTILTAAPIAAPAVAPVVAPQAVPAEDVTTLASTSPSDDEPVRVAFANPVVPALIATPVAVPIKTTPVTNNSSPVVAQQATPAAKTDTSIATLIAANPHSVLVSQSPELYQPVKNEESLGDVARRYRAKKQQQSMTSNGL